MAGKFGSDVDYGSPYDGEPMNLGAQAIREVKARLKNLLTEVFDLETGLFKPNSLDISTFADLPGPPTGTYRQFTVDSRGRVVSGTNPGVLSQGARISRGYWDFDGGSRDFGDAVRTELDPGPAIYTGTGVYNLGYESGSSYSTFTWTVPTGVRRVLFEVTGAGGGAATDGSGNRYGGAAGEHREGTFPVTPGTTITIIVGRGGTSNYSSPITVAGTPGGTSMISSGGNWVEAAGGGGASTSAVGAAQSGGNSTNVYPVVFPGVVGASTTPWETDSHAYRFRGADTYGTGGFPGTDAPTTIDGLPGFVTLGWISNYE